MSIIIRFHCCPMRVLRHLEGDLYLLGAWRSSELVVLKCFSFFVAVVRGGF